MYKDYNNVHSIHSCMFILLHDVQMLADFNLLERIAEAFEDNKSQPYVAPLMLMLNLLYFV